MPTGVPGPTAAPGPSLQQALRTEHRAVPGLVQALGLLTTTQAGLVELTERALQDSPVLERADGAPCPGCGRHTAGGPCRRCRHLAHGRELHEDTDAGTDQFRTLEAQARLEVRPGHGAELTVVLGHLTERGLLDAPVREIARLHGLEPGRVAEALRAVRAAGPPGLGAPDVTTLLAEQAAALVAAGSAPAWTADVVASCLPEVADDDPAGAARRLGITPAQAAQAFEVVRRRLRPAVRWDEAEPPARVPADVFVYRAADGGLDVEVPASAWFGLAIAPVPAAVAASAEARAWLRGHEDRARRLLAQIDARASVLERVARAAVGFQRGFLEAGADRHRPLTRTALAHELGMHPSTVSRAVKDKWMRVPEGRVEPLALLFGTSVAARAALARLLREAGGHRTDALLSGELGHRGFPVARRTVAKYRASLR
ncbi:hypothetical protein E7744_01085 [Citricoccus sp. SGAir0253]|uniref:RNA polymerase factor sigma-54 n=1 Tax=Citricoccus sp. SGAir0253 TaxID=2567881 RepID=UPI0010CD5813|nr:hypothetical protein [Citricoccus sp. SGAir0253]QCU76975.1 hypothetical protein E7744_01085 [Citricoccus sp. SGAir0253]